MKKIILINISILLGLIVTIIFFLKFINLFISGPPRYFEIVYNLERGSLREKKEKLIYYKSLNSKIKNNTEIKFYSDEGIHALWSSSFSTTQLVHFDQPYGNIPSPS